MAKDLSFLTWSLSKSPRLFLPCSRGLHKLPPSENQEDEAQTHCVPLAHCLCHQQGGCLDPMEEADFSINPHLRNWQQKETATLWPLGMSQVHMDTEREEGHTWSPAHSLKISPVEVGLQSGRPGSAKNRTPCSCTLWNLGGKHILFTRQ